MKKIFLSTLALTLILIFSVNATFTYLTDNVSVVNTFTVGQLSISLTEDTTARSSDSNILVPGLTYYKNSVITVAAESQPCWLFIKLENGVEDIEAKGDTSIAAQLKANDWLPLEDVEDIYYYSTPASAGANVSTFESFTISGDATQDALALCDGAKVGVTAYGIQAAGFDTAAKAWAEAKIRA